MVEHKAMTAHVKVFNLDGFNSKIIYGHIRYLTHLRLWQRISTLEPYFNLFIQCHIRINSYFHFVIWQKSLLEQKQ